MPDRRARPVPLSFAVVAIGLGTAYLAAAVSWRQAALFLVGGAAGVILHHAAFGFTSAWRVFITDRRGDGLRAQMLMLAVACAVFVPLIASSQFLGSPVRGSLAPLGLSVVVGAFLFGLGMQLGSGCASGTLYTAGAGHTRMLVTLAAFIAGSVLGVAHFSWWTAAPAVRAVSLVSMLGPAVALASTLALLGAIAGGSALLERRRHGRLLTPATSAAHGWQRVWRGPWPLAAGALGLAAVNIATLMLAGRPWGVTSAFALWGSKALAAMGVAVDAWPYWSTRLAELHASVFNDITSVMDIGIMLGALAASAAAGRFAPVWRVPLRSLTAAILGGLLLGYGARIAYGCNIGAFFSGVASGSLHGWVWFIAAFAGNIVGTQLRPLFGLSVEPRAPRRAVSAV
jgi:uncharacterized membrane protein YedE/YeeE